MMLITVCAVMSQVSPENANKELAQAYCGSCHAVPSPSDLPSAVWRDIMLPRMGYFLGRYRSAAQRDTLMESGSARSYLLERDIYPETPRVDDDTWRRIVEYYVSNAPDSLSAPDTTPLPISPLFRAVRPAFGKNPPSTTLLQWHRPSSTLFLGDAITGALYAFNRQLALVATAATTESPVCVSVTDSSIITTVMGSFSPTDAPIGKLLELPTVPGRRTRVLIDKLQRPVHHAITDLDGDGRNDVIICEFAKWTGGLKWWQQQTDGTYVPHILRSEPGAIRTEIRDWNSDGWPDILALIAQGNESLRLFLNNGDGTFSDSLLLQFPPSWGTSSFKLADMNGDGKEDVIHCAGDNADFGPILKPYHGLRVYLRSANGFAEPLFLQMNGSYGVVPADFDLDGDLDLAAISFFPNFGGRPQEAFVYFEQREPMVFVPSTFSEVGYGRWIVMDGGDIDEDGDTDLMLGSLTFEAPGFPDLVQAWAQGGVSFVLLENTARD